LPTLRANNSCRLKIREGGLRITGMAIERWQDKLGREIERLSCAPFFVQHPDALVLVRDELKRISEGRGTDLELEEDDDTWAIVDHARRLDATLAEARREIDERERLELDLFTAERLVEASLRHR
jgi:hypothetical protein